MTHGSPRWRGTIVLMLVAALIAGAGVYWWQQRSPNPGRTDVGFYDDMTTHHLQAIAISNAYIRNGRAPFLSQEAGEVSLGQAGDIRAMNLALESWHADTTDDVAMNGWACRCRKTSSRAWPATQRSPSSVDYGAERSTSNTAG